MKQRHMNAVLVFLLMATLPSLAMGQEAAEPAAAAEPEVAAEPAAASEPEVAAEPAAAASEPEVAAEPAAAAEPPAPAEPAVPAEPVASAEVSLGLSGLGGDGSGDTPLDERAKLGLVLGGKVGGGIGAPFSEFGASPVFELEIGFLLPLPAPVGRSIELFVTGQYTQPKVDGRVTEADPRLPGNGQLEYEVTQQELALTFGALYRIPLSTDLLMPYGGLGGRMYLLKTKVKGSGGGEAYGENEETASEFGFYAALGVDFFVGPGAIVAEVQMGYAALDGFVMRDTNVGALNLAVGYRLIL